MAVQSTCNAVRHPALTACRANDSSAKDGKSFWMAAFRTQTQKVRMQALIGRQVPSLVRTASSWDDEGCSAFFDHAAEGTVSKVTLQGGNMPKGHQLAMCYRIDTQHSADSLLLVLDWEASPCQWLALAYREVIGCLPCDPSSKP